MQFVPKEGEGFKLCYDFETNAYLPIEEHCGSYLFKNGGSLETIMLQLKYDKTATIYVPASDGKTWTAMVNGKYEAAKTPENSFTFTADEDGWIIPEAAYQAKFSAFTFQLGTANKYPVFEMYNADMAGKTITLGKNVYTFAGYNAVTCNLMTQMQDGTESLQLYKGDYRVCTPADGNTFFTYIEIKLSTGVTVLLVDVREDATAGTPEYKEFFGASYTNSYNNPGKYSAQIYPLTDDYMAVAVLDEATGEYKFTFLGTFVNQDKDEKHRRGQLLRVYRYADGGRNVSGNRRGARVLQVSALDAFGYESIFAVRRKPREDRPRNGRKLDGIQRLRPDRL